MTEIVDLYNVKIGRGGGQRILSFKDKKLIIEKVFSQHIDGFNQLMSSDGNPAVKTAGEGVSSAIFTL